WVSVYLMRNWRVFIRCLLLIGAARAAPAQTINGKDLAARSTGSQSGNGWSIGTTGFVGTYITVPAGGSTVSFAMNATQGASGTGTPHMNLVIADTKFSFDI